MALRKFENDEIVTIMETWWGNDNIVPAISMEENPLTKWDIRAEHLFRADGVPAFVYPEGVESGERAVYSEAVCTDNGHRIGRPYNPATFRPITNAEFLSLVKDSIAGTDHEIASCGSIRNRGRVFLSIKLNGMETFKAAGREFSAFLNFGNGHDKSSVLWVNTSNTCTVCDNTFSANLYTVEAKDESASQTDDLKISKRHTKNVALSFPALSKLIDKAIGVQASFALAMEQAATVAVSTDKAREIFAGFLAGKDAEKLSTRTVNTVDRLADLFKGGAGNSGRNLADAFSAVTDYYSHESSGGENRMKQFISSEYGAGAARKAEFLSLIGDGERLAKVAARGGELLAAN